ncbi:MAG: acyl-[acyl-carrier-protein]--UDP-N-acetylglucosamine O-acyltransferase [Cyanobacteria bacterium M5B4]|nr:MAG: acyl-[acyl-carrier-protein]--UDP-N-acetylglucosamine O-acyltransferase [Cyanobacteria bacterium M5B4]
MMLIHPTAQIHPRAEIHPSVTIGAYAVIGERVTIGEHTQIGAHVVIDGWTEIGARNKIFSGAVIGTEPQDLKYDGSTTLVTIGDDNLIREYVTINRATFAGESTIIGNHNLLMAYVHVGHNCVIQDRVVIANSVALSGHVMIESRARISGVLGVHQFVHIGQLAMVGGMSRIERDVPPFMTVEGNPARVRAINRIGLERAGLAEETIAQIKSAFRTLYRQGLTLKEALEQLETATNPYVRHLHDFLLASSTHPGRRHPLPSK